MKIDISGIDKALLLSALFNASKQQGMGFLDTRGSVNMTIKEAEDIIDADLKYRQDSLYFDYLYGRVMKIDIGGDELSTRLYDRDNGDGAAARVVDSIRVKHGYSSFINR